MDGVEGNRCDRGAANLALRRTLRKAPVLASFIAGNRQYSGQAEGRDDDSERLYS